MSKQESREINGAPLNAEQEMYRGFLQGCMQRMDTYRSIFPISGSKHITQESDSSGFLGYIVQKEDTKQIVTSLRYDDSQVEVTKVRLLVTDDRERKSKYTTLYIEPFSQSEKPLKDPRTGKSISYLTITEEKGFDIKGILHERIPADYAFSIVCITEDGEKSSVRYASDGNTVTMQTGKPGYMLLAGETHEIKNLHAIHTQPLLPVVDSLLSQDIKKRPRFRDEKGEYVPIPFDKENPKRSEGLRIERRYDLIADVLQHDLHDTPLFQEKAWSKEDLTKVEQSFLNIAPYSNSQVNFDLPEHLIRASLLMGAIAQKVGSDEITQIEARAFGYLHELGKPIDVSYLRSDLIGKRLERKIGMRQEEMRKLVDIARILALSKLPINSIEDMTLPNLIVDVGDNMGKTKTDGRPYDRDFFVKASEQLTEKYETIEKEKNKRLTIQEEEPATIPRRSRWPSTNAGLYAREEGKRGKVGIELVLEEMDFLTEKYGINWDELQQKVDQEMHLPENQAWIFAFQRKMQTLDRGVDEALGREPIRMIKWDLGDVLLGPAEEGKTLDDLLSEKMSGQLKCSPEIIINFFKSEATALAKGGKMTEEAYLRAFYSFIGMQVSENATTDELRKPFYHPEIYGPKPGMQELMKKVTATEVINTYFSDVISPLGYALTEALLHFYHPDITREQLLLSYEVGAAKAEEGTAAYEKFMELKKVSSSETVLDVDDNKGNAAKARKMGMKALLFRKDPYTGQTAAEMLEEELTLAGILEPKAA